MTEKRVIRLVLRRLSESPTDDPHLCLNGRCWVFTGTLAIDVLLPEHVGSLKAKRSVVRPIVAEIKRRFDVAVAEVGHVDLHRRTEIGVAVVAADAAHCRDVLEEVERHVAGRPEIELLSVHRQWHSDGDESSS